MIEIRGLTKRFGPTVAVDDLTFDVAPGRVTGFLGPNGAGKSTTMRMILDLDNADAGSVTVEGRPFREHRKPLASVGALLDAKAVHGGRTARAHLQCLAQSNQIPAARVEEVLDLVGLTSKARTRVKGFSLGMAQRLGIAAALLGDPRVLLFDEPVNGLDPEGIRWIRDLMRSLASQGRTVFVSSHLMSEMALTADHLVIIGRGRLVADTSVAEFLASHGTGSVRVRSPQAAELTDVLTLQGGVVETAADGALNVTKLTAAQVGEVAAARQIVLHELAGNAASLEDAYLQLTSASVEYHSNVPAAGMAR